MSECISEDNGMMEVHISLTSGIHFRLRSRTFIVAEPQRKQLNGNIDYRHTYINFSQLDVKLPKQGGVLRWLKLKHAQLQWGLHLLLGQLMGLGAFDFKQGDDKGNPFWKLLWNLLKEPNQEQIDCQHPKPILLDAGEMKEPYIGR
ncbi:hypothetical protein FNV43_RR17801 [Rhamnella rubrinervis]|uniref:Neutral/alkaline non-lysosomal ceramidase N-terminal domain-containing protein n=1 Tax=Rhamnella rubrinervis TaxID=2594499 RepID=A0A8K0E2F6_9ROSA|nr:hypothetical protein FNV43_RR17801 [Rhamnella rubrinervis]